MKLTTDEFLEKIGSFGRYQIAVNIFFNLCYALWWAIPVMISVFIASDPGWKCKNNSTCAFTDTISLGDKRYNHRCDIPREDWEFKDDFTSVVTEVNLYHFLVRQTVSQSTSQSVSQSVIQPVSQSVSQPVRQSASQPVSRSAGQPVSQSVSQ